MTTALRNPGPLLAAHLLSLDEGEAHALAMEMASRLMSAVSAPARGQALLHGRARHSLALAPSLPNPDRCIALASAVKDAGAALDMHASAAERGTLAREVSGIPGAALAFERLAAGERELLARAEGAGIL